MAIQTTTNLSSSVRARYTSDYLDAAMVERLYDQFAFAVPGRPMSELIRGSSVYLPFLSDMTPGVDAISQVADVEPQTLRDATTSVTPTSRGEALQCSQQILIQAYTDYGAQRAAAVGKNMMESVDLLAMEQAVAGGWVERLVARNALDAGESTHRASDAIFGNMQAALLSQKVPGFKGDGASAEWGCIMHPFVFHDIRESGNVDSIGTYQQAGIHLNFELGKIGPFRLIVSPWAKTFYGAGIDCASTVATTLSAAAEALDKTIDLTASTRADQGRWLNIGVEETGSTIQPTNERVKFISADGAGEVTIVGEGANGGLRFDHDILAVVNNQDSVYTMSFGGPQSIVKVFAPDVGEYGELVGPNVRGTLEQFIDLGWKWWGGYGLVAENRIVRYECSVSYEAV